MNIKALVDEDFVNYKKCAMFIGFPTCTFKCGKGLCQNAALAACKGREISPKAIAERFSTNPLSEAIVLGGLEPMDSFEDVVRLISTLRASGDNSDIVIYSGYDKSEVADKIRALEQFKNIIVKFGRYVPGDEPHYDDVLGVMLRSNNQYAEVIS